MQVTICCTSDSFDRDYCGSCGLESWGRNVLRGLPKVPRGDPWTGGLVMKLGWDRAERRAGVWPTTIALMLGQMAQSGESDAAGDGMDDVGDNRSWASCSCYRSQLLRHVVLDRLEGSIPNCVVRARKGPR